MLSQAYMAAKKLKIEHGIGVKVVNIPWLNVINEIWLIEVIGDIKQIYTLDNHLISGGQGEKIAATLLQEGLSNITIKLLGLKEIPVCGANHEILEYYSLDADSLVGDILKTMNRKS